MRAAAERPDSFTMMPEHHESTTTRHCTSNRPRTLAGAPARHCLYGGGGVCFFGHGCADETLVHALWAAADLLSALPLLLAVPIPPDRVAAHSGDTAPE